MTDSFPPFIHLRLHSEFSITDGITKIPDAISQAATYEMPALALTDLMNMFGMVKFYSGARSAGVKPIVGADIWVTNEEEAFSPYRLLLLCRHKAGYLELCEIVSRAYSKPKAHGRAEVSKAILQEVGTKGLIALSGGNLGDVGQALLQGNVELAHKRARTWQAFFPNAFYIELWRHLSTPSQEALIEASLDLCDALSLPPVATHPIQFLSADDFRAHEARVCIAEGQMLADSRRPRDFVQDQYFKSPEEMGALFADIPEAIANTIEIAKRCNFEIALGKSFLPDFPTPEGVSLSDFLKMEARRGLEERLLILFPDDKAREAARPTYEARLAIETDTIIQMGFPGYFLIVADFINWSKQNGVPVGPGRGSGAGSLVAFSLGITDLDPLRYALLFERFLNPERVSMPDFDIDFCQENRGRVIDYVKEKYGYQAVSQIATFGTLSSKAVIRDVGRVLDMPYSFCDKLSKLIPVEANKPLGLQEAIHAEPQLAEILAQEEGVSELFELAMRLEDLTRNVGMHAGGVLIAPNKLTDFCPLYSGDGGASLVSQFDKDDVEKVGLVKFDFLGLRNLTILALAVDYVERLTQEKLVLDTQHFADPRAYKILKDGNTTAIFQVESEGMKKLLKKLAPDRFEDIIAVLALYRPGPLGSGMVDDFILRKKGQQKIDYFHPDLKTCLEPTYGVIVYQEQVMQIAQIIGGYTLGGADLLRRAMGKKKAEEMALHRDLMKEGAAKKGYDEKLAMSLFDLMEKFAEYGFNKSHTAAYAVVTYQTAWLKAHHPSAFMAATLSSDLDNTDTIKIFYDDAIANGLTILPPDLNASDYRFVPVDASTIRYGLGAIKGTGVQAVMQILEARKEGDFADLFDFCHRVDKRAVNRRTMEALIRAGAFDRLDENRAKLLASLSLAMASAEQAERHKGQGSLFDVFAEDEKTAHAPSYIETPPFDPKTKLSEEKLALGFYFSGHPYLEVAEEVRRFVRSTLSSLSPSKDPQRIAGLVTSVRSKIAQRGKMLFVALSDGKTTREVIVYNEVLEKAQDKIREDEVLVMEVVIKNDDYAGEGNLRITAEAIETLAETKERLTKEMTLSLSHKSQIHPEHLSRLLQPFLGGHCPLRIAYQNQNASCKLTLGDAWRVRPTESLTEVLNAALGEARIALTYV